jgi:class 3 adenylate cyclase
LAESGAVEPVTSAAYLDALQRAEGCRRPHLVETTEQELLAVDREAHWRHVVGRLRGPAAGPETASLGGGTSELATVLCLTVRQYEAYCERTPPDEVLRTVNHVLADLEPVLERAEAQVTRYVSGGFLAVLRGPGHAARAVEAGLDLLAAVNEFNRPREILGLGQMPVRVTAATGVVCLGNVGTYRRMEFTALGGAVNLAVRLMRHVEAGVVCISRETRQHVGGLFTYAEEGARALNLGALGRREVYDVTGRKQGLAQGQR